MKKNQIKIKNLKNKRILYVTVKKDGIYNHYGKAIYCSCTGNSESTATKMLYNEETREVYCPNCHERKVEVLQTYAEYQQEVKERQAERLANLHLTLVGDDWECGQKYYALSTEIDYDDWLKVKKYFKYHKKGWSRYSELEFVGYEPSGWLTQNLEAVENILVAEGLIKPENTLEALENKARAERKAKEKARKEKKEKKEALAKEMKTCQDELDKLFESAEEISEAEARSCHFNATFGRGTIQTFTIKDKEIVKCRSGGDFIFGRKIKYSAEAERLLKKIFQLQAEIKSI